MSGPEDTDLPGGWEAAAAEYVLGLLPEDELRAFESQLVQDQALQQDVEAWEAYFAAFTDDIEEVVSLIWPNRHQSHGRLHRHIPSSFSEKYVGVYS